MTVAGETITTGASSVCPDCGKDALDDLRVPTGSGGSSAIWTYCGCGPYSRESLYIAYDLATRVAGSASAILSTTGDDPDDRAAMFAAVLVSAGVART